MARLVRSRYEPIEVVGRGGLGEILRAISADDLASRQEMLDKAVGTTPGQSRPEWERSLETTSIPVIQPTVSGDVKQSPFTGLNSIGAIQVEE